MFTINTDRFEQHLKTDVGCKRAFLESIYSSRLSRLKEAIKEYRLSVNQYLHSNTSEVNQKRIE